jgi:hypothetical protein
MSDPKPVPGDSRDCPVVVTREGGVESEYRYLERCFGPSGDAWVRVKQALITGPDGRSLDAITIELADGEQKTVYFDVEALMSGYLEDLQGGQRTGDG